MDLIFLADSADVSDGVVRAGTGTAAALELSDMMSFFFLLIEIKAVNPSTDIR